jgi:hypothetical protein
MTLYKNRKPAPDDMKADRAALLAIRELNDYAPINSSLSIESLNALEQALIQAEQEELRLQNALATARDTAATAAWALRNSIMSAKASVLAQYGPNSNAIQSLGLKKKSERRRPSRRNGAKVP